MVSTGLPDGLQSLQHLLHIQEIQFVDVVKNTENEKNTHPEMNVSPSPKRVLIIIKYEVNQRQDIYE